MFGRLLSGYGFWAVGVVMAVSAGLLLVPGGMVPVSASGGALPDTVSLHTFTAGTGDVSVVVPGSEAPPSAGASTGDGSCAYRFAYGTIVEFRALPPKESLFLRWFGDLDGRENPLPLELNGDGKVGAVFLHRDGLLASLLHAYGYTHTGEGDGMPAEGESKEGAKEGEGRKDGEGQVRPRAEGEGDGARLRRMDRRHRGKRNPTQLLPRRTNHHDGRVSRRVHPHRRVVSRRPGEHRRLVGGPGSGPART